MLPGVCGSFLFWNLIHMRSLSWGPAGNGLGRRGGASVPDGRSRASRDRDGPGQPPGAPQNGRIALPRVARPVPKPKSAAAEETDLAPPGHHPCPSNRPPGGGTTSPGPGPRPRPALLRPRRKAPRRPSGRAEAAEGRPRAAAAGGRARRERPCLPSSIVVASFAASAAISPPRRKTKQIGHKRTTRTATLPPPNGVLLR